jgi:hypothetical protein
VLRNTVYGTLVGDALQQFNLPSFQCASVSFPDVHEKKLNNMKISVRKSLRTRTTVSCHTLKTWSNGCHLIHNFDGDDGL